MALSKSILNSGLNIILPCKYVLFSILHPYKGACTNHVDSHGGRGGSWNVHLTNKAYIVKVSTKGGGGLKKSQKLPTWFVHTILNQKAAKKELCWRKFEKSSKFWHLFASKLLFITFILEKLKPMSMYIIQSMHYIYWKEWPNGFPK